MVNMYKCENCGSEFEIEPGHEDNKKITSMGWVYIDYCHNCNRWQNYFKKFME